MYKLKYRTDPKLSRGIGIKRRNPGYWWFEARENNTKATNELLNSAELLST